MFKSLIQTKFKQKGAVSVVLAILVLSVVLIIALSVSVLMLRQFELSNQIVRSVVAFYAAESGSERCLWEVRKNSANSCPFAEIPLDFNNQAKYTTNYNGSDTITSLGQFEEASRKLEISWLGGNTWAADCYAPNDGGSCFVGFSDFSSGSVSSARVEVCAEGDLNSDSEYVDIKADGSGIGRICESGCEKCTGTWEGCTVFDVTSQAQDNYIWFEADARSSVNDDCYWEQAHTFKARFIFTWQE